MHWIIRPGSCCAKGMETVSAWIYAMISSRSAPFFAMKMVYRGDELVSWDLDRRDYEEKGGEQNEEDDDFDTALFGCDIDTAIHSPYEIPEHAEGFPPCAVFMTETDELVNPEHSRLLQRTLQQKGIPCRLEAGPSGGHGFADGTGMCMAGWIERAVRWYEGQMC